MKVEPSCTSFSHRTKLINTVNFWSESISIHKIQTEPLQFRLLLELLSILVSDFLFFFFVRLFVVSCDSERKTSMKFEVTSGELVLVIRLNGTMENISTHLLHRLVVFESSIGD